VRGIVRTVNAIEDKLRRAALSFIVEVRRRPRLAPASSPNPQSFESKPPQASFDPESHRAAAAAFEAKKVDHSLVDVAASYPKGRILQSLVRDEPQHSLLRDPTLSAESDPISRVPKRPSVRPPKPRRTSRSSPAKNTPLADQLSAASFQSTDVQPDEGIGISRGDSTMAPGQVDGNSGGLARRAKPKRRDNIPSFLDDGGVVPLPIDRPTTARTDSLAMPPSSVDERSPQARKRTIMGRYVFGDELKPGECWKRRLLITRQAR